MKISNLHDLLISELRDLYSVEDQIIQSLPKLISEANDAELKVALTDHLELTGEHVSRLDQINEEVLFQSKKTTCIGLKGILDEGSKKIKSIKDLATRDAAIIAFAQKVEHYEISSYGTALSFAREMSHSDTVDLLQQTLDEEKSADEKLTSLAEGGLLTRGINEVAMQE